MFGIDRSDAERRAEELPYQLRKLDDKERLESVLLEEPMFNELYTPDNLQELMTYWEYLGGYDKAAPLYMDRLNPDLQVEPGSTSFNLHNNLTSLFQSLVSATSVRSC